MILRIAGTVALMALTLRNVDWPRLFELFETVDWRWWGAGLGLGLVVQCLAAIRWAVLARPIGFREPVTVFIRRFFEGQFFSLCLPTSIGGDVVKAYRLSATTRGRVLAGCTVLADRLAGLSALGVIALTALISAGGGFHKTPAGRVQTPTLAMIVERERSVIAFIPQPYWEAVATIDLGQGTAVVEAKWRADGTAAAGDEGTRIGSAARAPVSPGPIGF
jgi:uncharacterized membrane protein YbhN (UPF0104 family)